MILHKNIKILATTRKLNKKYFLTYFRIVMRSQEGNNDDINLIPGFYLNE